MLNLYEEYNSPEDREAAVILENAEIAMQRAILARDTCLGMEELNIREAEAKVVLESGDMNSLLEFYEEAGEKTEEKKKGVFSTVWDSIVGLLDKIRNFITGKKEKNIDPNKQYEVGSDDVKEHGLIGQIMDQVKKFMSSGPGKILAIVGTTGALMFLYYKTKKGKKDKGEKVQDNGGVVKVAGSKLIAMTKKSKECIKALTDAAKNAKSKKMNGKEEKESQGCISKIVSWIKDHVQALLAKVGSVAGKGKDTSGEEETGSENNQDNNQGGNDESGNGTKEESAFDPFDLGDDMFAEDAAGLDEIAQLLATI